MINEKELRIGSIVTVDNPEYHPKLKDIPLIVTGIQERVIKGETKYCLSLEHINQKPNTYYETYSQYMRFIRPIPLTEEILLKCGAEPTETKGIFLLGDILVDIDLGIAMLDIKLQQNYRITPLLGRCKYLHQLQNIWFTRKYKELEVSYEQEQ